MKFLNGISCLLLALPFFGYAKTNDYSSFLTSNASLAVVVDRDYMLQRGENVLGNFQKILSDIIRENMKTGGINVKYFTWNSVYLKKDFIAAITITDCESTWKFYEATKITNILLLAITDADCPRLPMSHALMIPMVENIDVFPQILLDCKVQNLLKWKSAVVLLDQSIMEANPILVKSIVHESTRNQIPPISLYLYKIDDSLRSQKKRAAIHRLLEPFSKNLDEQMQFLIISKFHEDIIEIAELMNMFHVHNQWLFFVLEATKRTFDAAGITQNLNEGTNIAFLLNETMAGCMDTLNCTIAELSMGFVSAISRIIAEEESIYGDISDEEWESIRYTKQEKQIEILNHIKNYLKANSKCASCSKWRIETAITWGKSQEHFKYHPNKIQQDTNNNNFEFVDVGYWTPVLGFITQEQVFPHIEHYFRNITMDILTFHNPPWQIIKRDSKGAIIEHKGIVMEIIKELSHLLNFTYQLHEFKPQNEEDLLNLNENETLLGTLTYNLPYQIVELVHKNQYFLVAVATTIDEPDKKPFNYTIPVSVQKYSFISRKPDEVSRIYLFTAPFTVETWASLVAVILITSPILYIINRLVPLQHLKIVGLCNVKNCFWYIYGALLQQGGIYLPKADSGRLVVGVWWIVVIVLVTTYCGNLVAFLTFPKFQPGLDYLFQVFKRNDIQMGLRNGTFFQKYAPISNRPEYRRYLNLATVYNNAQQEDIMAVKQGKRINLDWRINLQLIIQNQFEKEKECTFSLSKELFLDEQIGLIVPSNSPYLLLINEKIKLMFQMGFIERWHQTNLPSMDKCNGKGVLRQITNHKVNLDDMQGCFLVLLLGFIFAIFVIMIEFWYYRLFVVDKKKKPPTYTN